MWLLEPSIREAIEDAAKNNVAPTKAQQEQFQATHVMAASGGNSRLLSIAGNSAEITIKGVMTETPSFLAMLFGGGNVTYGEIVSAINDANQNEYVTDITLRVDSPGGTIDGLFDAIDAIKNSKKPVTAQVRNKAASAAYGIVAAASKIEAVNAAASFGSVGVVQSHYVSKFSVDVTSTKAPKKRPDASTEEGRAIIREELDPIHDLFVDAIATGRNTSADMVNANFGQGGMLLAGEALKRGMIDSVQAVKHTNENQTAANGGDNTQVKSMDLEKLKAEHPEAYAAAAKVGHAQGVAAENDRISAHLIMGESSGDMKTALTACKDGSGMTATLQATYQAAGMNRQDTQSREDDDGDAAIAAAAIAAAGGEGETDAEKVAAGIEAIFGTGDKD